MGFNQLFIKKPDLDILIKILNCLGLEGLNDDSEFSKLDFIRLNSLIKFQEIKDEVSLYYLPCKKTIYFNNVTNKTLITVTRQFLKIFNYTLESKEKYISGKKYIIYKLVTMEEKIEKKNCGTQSGKIVVKFD